MFCFSCHGELSFGYSDYLAILYKSGIYIYIYIYRIVLLGHNIDTPAHGVRLFLLHILKYWQRLGLFLCGFYWIPKRRLDMDLSKWLGPDYTEPKAPAPILITNHTTPLVYYRDIVYNIYDIGFLIFHVK